MVHVNQLRATNIGVSLCKTIYTLSLAKESGLNFLCIGRCGGRFRLFSCGLEGEMRMYYCL